MSTQDRRRRDRPTGTGRPDVQRLHADLAACRRALGPDHPDALQLSDALAHALERAGRPDEAVVGFEVTHGARRRLLGDDHPDTRRSADDLIRCYRTLGRNAEAESLSRSHGAGGQGADSDGPNDGR